MKNFLIKKIVKLLNIIRKCEVYFLKSQMYLGERVIIKTGFQVTHPKNVAISDDVYINVDVVVMSHGGVEIGSQCIIAPRVQIISVNHDLGCYGLSQRDSTVLGKVQIGEGVWIGAGAIVLPGVTIGENAVIGAGSIVTKSIPANAIAIGNPCKVAKFRES